MLDAMAGHGRAVRVVEAAAAGFGEAGAGVRDDDGAAHGRGSLDVCAHTRRGRATAKARIAASAPWNPQVQEMAWLLTRPPPGTAESPDCARACAATPPRVRKPRPRSLIHLAISSDMTPATMPTRETVNGLSVGDVPAACGAVEAMAKPAMAALART